MFCNTWKFILVVRIVEFPCFIQDKLVFFCDMFKPSYLQILSRYNFVFWFSVKRLFATANFSSLNSNWTERTWYGNFHVYFYFIAFFILIFWFLFPLKQKSCLEIDIMTLEEKFLIIFFIFRHYGSNRWFKHKLWDTYG